jgi:hypothetical protein
MSHKNKNEIHVHYKITDGKKIAGWRYVNGLCRYTKMYESNTDIDFIVQDCKDDAVKNGRTLTEVYWHDPFLEDLYYNNTHCKECSSKIDQTYCNKESDHSYKWKLCGDYAFKECQKCRFIDGSKTKTNPYKTNE